MKKIKKLLNILSLFVFIIFLSNINILISKEYRWQMVDSNKLGLQPYILRSSFVLDKNSYICGGYANGQYPYIQYTIDAGRTWVTALEDIEVNKFTQNTLSIDYIFWDDEKGVIAFSDSGYYYKSNNLKDWERKQLKFKDVFKLQDVSQFNNLIIVSYYDILFKSLDYGNTWEELIIPNNNNTNYKTIYEISIISDDIYYATYFYNEDPLYKSYFMKTTNGGETWEEVTELPSYFNELIFINENVGFSSRMVNDIPTIYKTIDAGMSWDIIFNTDFGYYNSIYSFLPVSENEMYLTLDNDSIYYTEDSFKTYTTDPSYFDLYYTNSICLSLIEGKKLLNPTIHSRIYIYSDENLLTGINLPEVLTNTLVFPNPSSDRVSVDLGEIVVGEVADLTIYDILGNEIMSIPNYTNKSEIDVSTIPVGTYTIQIQTKTGSISQRLLVNR